jgi:subtilase family serine protease
MLRDAMFSSSVGPWVHAKESRWGLCLFAILFTGCSIIHAQIRPGVELSTATTALPNHVPQWATAANDAGALPAGEMLENLAIVVARTPEQQQAFDEFTREQQEPPSPGYHRWLTAREIGEQFGRSTQEIQSLTSWLASQGLTVKWVSASRTVIRFGGTAANVGKAFQTQLHLFNVRGTQRMSVISAPAVPAALAPLILAVRGLYSTEETPLHHRTTVQSPSPEFTVGSSYFIAPADFDTIYDVPTGLTGAGVTVGIVGESRTDFADFANFRSLTGSTFANPTEIIPTAQGGVDPGPALISPPAQGVDTSAQGEAELDVFRVGSVAPAAKIELVVATAASGGIDVDAEYLVDASPAPQVMSISFGGCEYLNGVSDVNYWNQLFQQGVAEGMSIFVSSGDGGAAGCDEFFVPPPSNPDPISPNDICSSSYATCVGGTEFNDTANPAQYWSESNGAGLSSALGYIPEGAWNEPLNNSTNPPTTRVAATGGGVSGFIATPSWQTGVGVPSARTGRDTPDVAFSASEHDGYVGCFAAGGGSCVVSNGGYTFTGFYGTSAAAPGMAGVAALLDQRMGSAQGNLNPVLYQLAANVPAVFHDVTVASSGVSGCSVNTPSMCNNSVPGTTALTGGEAGYLVGDGFDEATGLGSLDVKTFLDSVAGTGPTISALSLNPASVADGGSSTLTITLSAAAPTGGADIALTSSNASLLTLPASVTITAGQTSGTATLQAGTATAATTVTITASYGGSSQQTQLTIGTTSSPTTPTVTLAPSVSSISTDQSLSVTVTVSGGTGGATPSGSVTVTSGSYMSAATTLSGGAVTISIAAGALSVGSDTLTAAYTPDAASSAVYDAATGTATVTVTAASYAMTATAVSMNPGGSGSSTVTISSTNDYAGTVSLSCAITASPSGATDVPTCAAAQSVTLSSSATTGTAMVTLSSTAASSQSSKRVAMGRPWTGLGATLAILLFAVPRRSRLYRAVFGLVLVGFLAAALVACGGGSSGGTGNNTQSNPGTTAGSYTVTVTGTGNDSAKTTTSTTFALTVI